MTLQAEAKHNVLALLGAPAGAIHHPEEIWLDPAHAPVREITVQGAVPNGIGTDRWPIGLIDDNRCRVMVRQDVPTRAGPRGVLGHVPFRCEVHRLPRATQTARHGPLSVVETGSLSMAIAPDPAELSRLWPSRTCLLAGRLGETLSVHAHQ